LSDERVERRLAAVLAADVAGYSRLMGADEEGTLARLKASRKALVDPAIASHRGRIVKTTGDGVLVEFASAVDAIRCAMEIQRNMTAQNDGVPQETRIEFRIGIHVGDIIFDENDIFGDGVNIAARLEGIAEPGGICLSDDAQRQIRSKVDVAFDDMGPQALKNIAEPMRAWRVQVGTSSTSGFHKSASASSSPTLALPDKPSIAVLPFQNMSGDPEQEYFADGVVEDIITALSRVKWFFVIARNSSFTYKGKAVDIKQVGRELGVRYVLEGSVRKAGGRVRITGQLIEAETGHHIWADRFEGDYSNIFELQDEVTSAVAAAVEPALSLREIDRSSKRPTSDPTAYDCFLRAQPFMRLIEAQSYMRAEELLRRAVAIDPNYSSALAYLADCIGRQCIFGARPYDDGIREAERIAQHAVDADPEDAAALAVASWVLSIFIGRHVLSREYAERALRLHPNSAYVCSNCAQGYVNSGDLAKARKIFERALRINPLDPRNYFVLQGLGQVAFFEKNFNEALQWFTRTNELAPTVRVSWRFKAATLVHMGRIEEARDAATVLRTLTPVQTLQELVDRSKYDAWMRKLYFEALAKAGYE
jgi:adenylate cyclase